MMSPVDNRQRGFFVKNELKTTKFATLQFLHRPY